MERGVARRVRAIPPRLVYRRFHGCKRVAHVRRARHARVGVLSAGGSLRLLHTSESLERVVQTVSSNLTRGFGGVERRRRRAHRIVGARHAPSVAVTER